MNKLFNLLSVVGLTLIIGLLPSCGGKPNPYSKTAEEYDEISKCFAADESIMPVMDEELMSFHLKTKRGPLFPLYVSEQEAVEKLLNLDVFVIFTSRSLTPNEVEIIKSKQYKARMKEMAYDALALVVNKENPDTVITLDQFRRILTGEAGTWRELFPTSKYDSIRVAFDNPRSSAVRFCNDSILKGKQMKVTGNIRAVNSSPAVIDYVEKHRDAIGIVGCNWLNNKRDTTNLTYGRNIKVMRVGTTPLNAREPHQAYIAMGEYPLRRTLWSICIDPRSNGNARAFQNFVLSPSQKAEGQLIFYNAGMWPAYRDYHLREVESK